MIHFILLPIVLSLLVPGRMHTKMPNIIDICEKIKPTVFFSHMNKTRMTTIIKSSYHFYYFCGWNVTNNPIKPQTMAVPSDLIENAWLNVKDDGLI